MSNTQIVLIFAGICAVISCAAVWLMVIIGFFLGEDKKERKGGP
jgi:hypothetical protein